jgi:glucokinase
MAEDLVVGVDLGGTKIISAVLDSKHNVLTRNKRKTEAQEGAEAVFQRIVDCIEASVRKAGVSLSTMKGIGVASPGPLNSEKGVILDTPNLGFCNFPLAKRLAKELGVPVRLENDVNAGVYGEFLKGAARGYRHVVGIFPGTGIGGGLVLNGRLFKGAEGNAGEIGHMIIQTDGPLCGCGRYGCVEALASRTALAKDAAALAGSGSLVKSQGEASTDLKSYKSGTLSKAIARGEKEIEKAVLRSARFLGVAMANCVNLLNPEVIVLGGGLVEKLGDMYVHAAEESMKEHAMPNLVGNVKVLVAALGDEAALVGISGLLREWLEERAKE